MSVEQYSLVAHDWLNLEFIINDLASRVIGQELGPTSEPTFAELTLTGLTETRVLFAGASGVISDDAGLTYALATDILTSGSYNATDEDNVLQVDGTTVFRIGTVASNNLFFGKLCGDNVTTGINNFGAGTETLEALTEGGGNFALGKQALEKLNEGAYNVAVGITSLANITVGNRNVAIGRSAGNAAPTSTSDSIYIGDRAGLVGGASVVHIGSSAGLLLNGTSNVFIGRDTGWGTSGGAADSNTCIGSFAARVLDDGDDNVVIGYQSAYLLTQGSLNVFLGYKSGYNQTTNSNLLIIDNQDRTSTALEITNSLIYGVFDAVPANQSLRVNAGTFILGNPVHSDADGGGAVLLQGIREDGAGTPTVAGQIEISHDGIVANGQLGKMILSVNTGAALVEALEIGSDLLATFAGAGSFGSNIFFNSSGLAILANTEDGSDTYHVSIAGGGNEDTGRGGFITVRGNENAQWPGDVYLGPGGAAGAGVVCGTGLFINEQTAADTDRATYGQIWAKNDAPNTLWFTDDVGIDHAISPKTLTVTTGAYDALDISGVNTVFLDCSGGAITIGGFVGGVNGQVLYLARLCASADNITLEHLEGTGNQDIYLHAGIDETLFTEYGGWILVCNGTSWFDTSHAKHV